MIKKTRFKRVLAVITCISMVMTSIGPVYAAQETSPADEAVVQEEELLQGAEAQDSYEVSESTDVSKAEEMDEATALEYSADKDTDKKEEDLTGADDNAEHVMNYEAPEPGAHSEIFENDYKGKDNLMFYPTAFGNFANTNGVINFGNKKIESSENINTISEESDDLEMWYYQLPADTEFKFSAKVKVEDTCTPDNMAFGLMVRDDMYIDGFNTVGINSAYVAAGIGDSIGAQNGFYRDNYCTLHTFDGTCSPDSDGEYRMTIEGKLVDDEMLYSVKSGTEADVKIVDGLDLTEVDDENIYLGLFLSGKGGVTFSNVKVLIRDDDGTYIAPGSVRVIGNTGGHVNLYRKDNYSGELITDYIPEGMTTIYASLSENAAYGVLHVGDKAYNFMKDSDRCAIDLDQSILDDKLMEISYIVDPFVVIENEVADHVQLYRRITITDGEQIFSEADKVVSGNQISGLSGLYLKFSEDAPEGDYFVNGDTIPYAKGADSYKKGWAYHKLRGTDYEKLVITYEPYDEITINNEASEYVTLYAGFELDENKDLYFPDEHRLGDQERIKSGSYIYAKATENKVNNGTLVLEAGDHVETRYVAEDGLAGNGYSAFLISEEVVNNGGFRLYYAPGSVVKINNQVSDYTTLYKKIQSIYDKETGKYNYTFFEPVGSTAELTKGETIYVKLSDNAPYGRYYVHSKSEEKYNNCSVVDINTKYNSGYFSFTVRSANISDGEIRIYREDTDWMKYNVTIVNDYPDEVAFFADNNCNTPFSGSFEANDIYVATTNAASEDDLYLIRNSENRLLRVVTYNSGGNILYGSINQNDTLTVEKSKQKIIRINNTVSDYISLYKTGGYYWNEVSQEWDDWRVSDPIGSTEKLYPGKRLCVELSQTAPYGRYFLGSEWYVYDSNNTPREFEVDEQSFENGELIIKYEENPYDDINVEIENRTEGKVSVYTDSEGKHAFSGKMESDSLYFRHAETDYAEYYIELTNENGTKKYDLSDNVNYSVSYEDLSSTGKNKIVIAKKNGKEIEIKISENIIPYVTVYNRYKSVWNGYEYEDVFSDPYDEGKGTYYGGTLYVQLSDNAPAGNYYYTYGNNKTYTSVEKGINRHFQIETYYGESIFKAGGFALSYEPFEWTKKSLTIDDQSNGRIGVYCDSECTKPFTGRFTGSNVYLKAKVTLSESEAYEISAASGNTSIYFYFPTVILSDADPGPKSIDYSFFSDVDTLCIKNYPKTTVKINNPYSEYVKLYRKYDEGEYSLPINGSCSVVDSNFVIYFQIDDEAPDGYYGIMSGKNFRSVAKNGTTIRSNSINLYSADDELTVEYRTFPWSKKKITVNNKSGGSVAVYNGSDDGVISYGKANYSDVFDGEFHASTIYVEPVHVWKEENNVGSWSAEPLPDGVVYAVRSHEKTLGYLSGSGSVSIYYDKFGSEDTLTIEEVKDSVTYKVREEDGLTNVIALYEDEECSRLIKSGSGLKIKNTYYLKCSGEEDYRYTVYVYDGDSLIKETTLERGDMIPVTVSGEGEFNVFVPADKKERGVRLTVDKGEYSDDDILLSNLDKTFKKNRYNTRVDELEPAQTGDHCFPDTVIQAFKINKDLKGNVALRTTFSYKDGEKLVKEELIPYSVIPQNIYIYYWGNKRIYISEGTRLDFKSYFNDDLQAIAMEVVKLPDSVVHLSENMVERGLEVYSVQEQPNLQINMEIPDSWVKLKDGDVIDHNMLVIHNVTDSRRYYRLKAGDNEEKTHTLDAGEFRYFSVSGAADVYISAENGFKLNVSCSEGISPDDYSLMYTMDDVSYQPIPEDGLLPYKAKVRVKSRGLNGTDSAYVVYDADYSIEYDDWWNEDHYSHWYHDYFRKNYLMNDDDEVGINVWDVTWLHIEKRETCGFTLENKVVGKAPEISYYIGEEMADGPEIQPGSKVIKGDKIRFEYSPEKGATSSYSMVIDTKDAAGNAKQGKWLLGNDRTKGEIRVFDDVSAVLSTPSTHRLVVSGIPDGFDLYVGAKSSGKDVRYSKGVQNISAGESVSLEAFRTDGADDRTAIKLINTADNSVLGYTIPENRYFFGKEAVDFTMPDKDVILKAVAADTAELFVDSASVKSIKVMDPKTEKKYNFLKDYEDGDYFYPDSMKTIWNRFSYLIPVGEKVELEIDCEHINRKQTVSVRTENAAIVQKDVYAHDRFISFLMPAKNATVTTTQKKLESETLTIKRTGFSENTKVHTYLDDYDLGYDSTGTSFYENQELKAKVAQLSDDSKLLVKVEKTGTNEIVTGSSQGVVIDSLKDFVYRLLGMNLTLDISEIASAGEGNTVYISETLSKDSSVSYSVKNGTKAKAGDEVKINISKVSVDKKLAVNVICPDQNLVASGAGIVNDFSKPLVSVVTNKAFEIGFDMPEYPVEVIVYEVSSKTPSKGDGSDIEPEPEPEPEPDPTPDPVNPKPVNPDPKPTPEPTPEEVKQQKIVQVEKAAEQGFGSVEDTIKVATVGKKNVISYDPTVKENVVTIIKGNKLAIEDPQAVEKSYATNNPAIVKISKKGVITAKNPGEAIIAYKGGENGTTDCLITVKVVNPAAQKEEASAGDISFKKLTGTVKVGSEYAMVVALPINATCQISDKKGVMGVKGTDYTQSYTPDGKFEFKGTAKAKGTATITFTVYGKKVKVKIKAKE